MSTKEVDEQMFHVETNSSHFVEGMPIRSKIIVLFNADMMHVVIVVEHDI